MTIGYLPTTRDTDGYTNTTTDSWSIPLPGEAPTRAKSTTDLDLARKRFKQCEDAETNQRERERADLSFYEGEGQWPAEIKNLRLGRGAQGGVPAVPARPCLTINKVKDPIRHTINEFLQADLGVSVIPADDFEGEDIDESEIELREGLIRRYQRNSQADEARLWAVSRAEIAGRGFYGIMTRDVPGPTMDQEIYYRRFYNQFSVMLDPAHEEPDGSDAEWAFVGTDVPWNVYKAEYGYLHDGTKNPLCSTASDSEWRAIGDEAPKWFTFTDEKISSCRVVEYWHIERTPIEYVALPDGSIVDAKQVDKLTLATIPPERRKQDVQKKVIFTKLDGKCRKPLEETEFPITHIPIIKVVGEEMHPFDQERRSEGMVRAARDSQQAFNYMVSAAVELIGLAPKDPPIGAAGQFEGFEAQWDQAHVRTIGRLEYNATTPATGGTVLPMPMRAGKEPPIQAMAQMMSAFAIAIHDTTGIPNESQGNISPSVRSGRAIKAIVEQGIRGTSNYIANAIRSAHYEGTLINELLYPTLMNRVGRRVRVMKNTRHETEPVMLGVPFVIVNGRPVKFDPVAHQGQEPKVYKLTQKPANIAIKVSKNFDTQREQEQEQLGDLMSANPEFMTWFGDLWFKSMSTPGHQELAARAKAMLAPPIQKLINSDQPPDPEKMQMQQQMEAMGAELQQLQTDKAAKIESAQIKAQSDAMQTEADNATKVRVAEINAAAALAVADLKASAQQIIESAKASVEQFRLVIEQEHETRLTDKQLEHEAQMTGHEHGHAAAMADKEHGHALEQSVTDAALTPEPEPSDV